MSHLCVCTVSIFTCMCMCLQQGICKRSCSLVAEALCLAHPHAHTTFKTCISLLWISACLLSFLHTKLPPNHDALTLSIRGNRRTMAGRRRLLAGRTWAPRNGNYRLRPVRIWRGGGAPRGRRQAVPHTWRARAHAHVRGARLRPVFVTRVVCAGLPSTSRRHVYVLYVHRRDVVMLICPHNVRAHARIKSRQGTSRQSMPRRTLLLWMRWFWRGLFPRNFPGRKWQSERGRRNARVISAGIWTFGAIGKRCGAMFGGWVRGAGYVWVWYVCV
jgi:hypothetical protein